MPKPFKEKQILQFENEPIKVGDFIHVIPEHSRSKNSIKVKVEKVDSNFIYYYQEGYSGKDYSRAKREDVKKYIGHIGVNPFAPSVRGTANNIDIWQLLYRCGYQEDRTTGQWNKKLENWEGKEIDEVCLNPIVIDKSGNEVEYQRGLVWSLEQKQLLIESIYNHIEIGKFVIRPRPYSLKTDWVQKRLKENKIEHTAFKDLVDGKQRLTAIIEFVNNKFKDLRGNYYSDLSAEAQRTFKNYRQLTYFELDENVTDEDTLKVFLAINFAGVPMSKEHIDFVKSIKIN